MVKFPIYGWTNFKDEWVIKPLYYSPSSFERGGSIFPYSTGQHIKYNKRACLFDTKGNIILPPKYKSIYTRSFQTNGYLILEHLNGKKEYYTVTFKPIAIPGVTIKWLGGYIDSPYLVYRNQQRLYGYISKDGQLLQKAKYIKALRPSEGFSWAQDKK